MYNMKTGREKKDTEKKEQIVQHGFRTWFFKSIITEPRL